MNADRFAASLALASSLTMIALLAGCSHRPAPAPRREARVLRMTAHEFQFGLPAKVPAGLTHVRLVNDGGYWHHALFARLDSTQSVEGYLAQIRAGADFPSGAVDMGGPALTRPGDSTDLVMNLTPGRWAVLCTASGGGTWHVQLGMIAPLEVEPVARGDEPSEPPADLTLVMTDSTFEFPDTLAPGIHWVRIENRGTRWHECDILRLAPGKTIADDRHWRTVDHQLTPAPSTPVGGCSDFGPGVVQWSLVTFEAGHHLMVCDMPGDEKHVRKFEVVPHP